MSQWGAQGYASQADREYRWILGHYYDSTEIRTLSTNPYVRVTLAEGRSSVTVGSASPFKVTDAGGKTRTLAAGAQTIGPGLRIRTASGARRTLASPAKFKPGESPLSFDGARYRGFLILSSNGSAITAVNKLRLEAYVKGVVPMEVYTTWDPEALKAQAVAARTYALAVGGLTTTTTSQVYGGLDEEAGSTNAAVEATAREVVWWTAGDRIAETYFFSTSGGSTVSAAEEWGSDPVLYPYLQTEDDPYDTLSPHHRWGPFDDEIDCPTGGRDCVFTVAGMSSRLGISGIRDMTVTRRNSGHRVERVAITTAGGGRARTGAAMRTALGLRSTWFSIGVLSLVPERTRVVWGRSLDLNIIARGVANTVLQRRPYGGDWVNVIGVTGTGPMSVSPRKETSYRLSSPAASTVAARVLVAAKILLTDGSAAGLSGIVRPVSLAGRTVVVDRQRLDGSWARGVARATVASDGSFHAALTVRTGRVYRARITPPSTSGLVRGISPEFQAS